MIFNLFYLVFFFFKRYNEITMKLEFKINKYALIKDVFVQNFNHRKDDKSLPFPFWRKLENSLWKKFCNEPSYYLISPEHFNWGLKEIFVEADKIGFKKTFLNVSNNLEKIYKEIIKTKEFERLLSETEEYKRSIEKQWDNKEEFILDYFKNTLGLEIPDYIVTVYVFHPKSFCGHANAKTKTILWGHSEDWENYTMTYLAHEVLHIIINKKSCSNIMHAIIELATDNELRIRLNGKSVYFKEKERNIGHKHLQKIEKEILPYWEKFLGENKDKKNIFSLEKEIKNGLD